MDESKGHYFVVVIFLAVQYFVLCKIIKYNEHENCLHILLQIYCCKRPRDLNKLKLVMNQSSRQ